MLKIQFVRKEYVNLHKKEKEEEAAKGQFSHTGRLGETMKESVEVVKIAVFNFLALEFPKTNFEKDSYHLHIPQGAIPKDGPSAGTSTFAALVSIALREPVIGNIALTGEITTLGEVISIGGVREKLTACKNHGITRVILPESNQKHIKKLPEEFRRGFTIFYVRNVKQVHSICFNKGADNIEKLRSEGIMIEEYGEDDLQTEIARSEVLIERNFINDLL